ncbi:MAG: catechol 2,3-dioxygenase-like lactoylglutathione lyase family enzyme [Flavobacteriaceae bacterium]|jgi:catechol 2,3-dioxygenase-like lactoylglutathione lyase family enzyme|uniref:VOC family protein n=1 Tax=Candidatus Marifrigoribacter sp. Uisw_064 TaxID=3230970 RepID=UPI003AEDB7AE
MNLNQVTIPSLDVEKSVAFYKTLGLLLIVKSYPRYARFECPDGEATFSIHLVEKLAPKNGTSIYFEEKELDEKVNELQGKGITFDQLPEDKSWGWREAYLTDPDGNQLILFFGGDTRKNPPWRITE